MIANAALPSFLPHSFFTLAGILLIAAIEGLFICRYCEIGFKKGFHLALIANWFSTILGIPLAWVLWIAGLLPISLVASFLGLDVHPLVSTTLFQMASAGGYAYSEWVYLGGAIAWILSLPLFYLGSVWVESRVVTRREPELNAKQVKKSIKRGNLASYSLFLLVGLFMLYGAIEQFPAEKKRAEQWREERESRKKNNEVEQESSETAPY